MWPFSRHCTDVTGEHAAGILQWETVASLPCPPLPASWSLAHRAYDRGQAVVKGMSTWSKAHRLDAGGVEGVDDCVPGPHPPAGHIPIGAGQALCVPENVL